jgi:hypothetical protein
MTFRARRFSSRPRALVAALALSSLLMATGHAWPQAASPSPAPPAEQQPAQAASQAAPPQATPPPPQAASAPPENPGLINEIGKLIDKITPTMKSTGERLDDLHTRAEEAVTDTARGAGDALSRLKPGSMVSGRVACPLEAGGTPDCKLGADKLCQSKGYKEGKSLSTDAAQTCSPKVLIPGRQRKPDDCRTDNYVTTALCM